MRLTVLKNINDVVERQMCCGCGVCAYLDPERFEMVDTLDHGRRPMQHPTSTDDGNDADAMQACPGRAIKPPDHPPSTPPAHNPPGWGPILEVWEGHAADPEVRFAGSSGGVASALALASVEFEDMHGVLHTRARTDVPYLNQTVLSTTRQDILAATGSRYAPASPCDGLSLIESAPSPCIFIGKPCDVAAATRAADLRPALHANLALTISLFCAGTPNTRATLDLLSYMGEDNPPDLVQLRYRGNGWPGDTVAIARSSAGYRAQRLDYATAWGQILTNNKQWRCHVCADHSGESADISVADAWHHQPEPGDHGRSIVVVRTERGRRFVRRAIDAGYLNVHRTPPSVIPAAQRNLLRARGAVWGRILACRLLGLPTPSYPKMPLFRFWWSELTIAEKVRSLLGVVRRSLVRRLHRRTALEPLDTPARPAQPDDAARPAEPLPPAIRDDQLAA